MLTFIFLKLVVGIILKLKESVNYLIIISVLSLYSLGFRRQKTCPCAWYHWAWSGQEPQTVTRRGQQKAKKLEVYLQIKVSRKLFILYMLKILQCFSYLSWILKVHLWKYWSQNAKVDKENHWEWGKVSYHLEGVWEDVLGIFKPKTVRSEGKPKSHSQL